MNWRSIACAVGALALCGAPSLSFAQGLQIGAAVESDGNCPTTAVVNTGVGRFPYETSKGALCISGTFSANLAVSPLTTTETAGTVTTHGTFQTALASSGTRAGCTIQNTSTDVELVFFGANGSASIANAFALGPAATAGGQGGAISCAIGGLGAATDNIAITSKTNDGATYVVSHQ